MTTLAERLRLAREQAGLSQGQVAKMLGMHRPTISEIEKGGRKVKAEELPLFADAYGVTGPWLAGTDGEADVDARVMLAARELSTLKADDLDRVLRFLASLRESKGGGK